MRPQFEIELRLLLVGDEPTKVIDYLRDLKELGKYRFVDLGEKKIHDTYFDTRDGFFAGLNYGLRIRRLNDKLFVTLKGKPIVTKNDSVQRSEMELPWSKKAQKKFLNLFEELGMAQAKKIEIQEHDTPEQFFDKLGLRVIHERYNHRTMKLAIEGEKELLEIAIDQMIFPIESRNLKLFEIELEQKCESSDAAMEMIKNHLMKKFDHDLQVWSYSKLATGLAISQLAKDKSFLKTISNDGRVTKESYQIIGSFFRDQGIGVS